MDSAGHCNTYSSLCAGDRKPAVVTDNTLDRQFDIDAPDRIWVTDITYIRTHEGWSYLAVVIDLFSRRVIGWSMQSRMTTDLALQVLLVAVWRRKPKQKVMIHSDQGSQFTGGEWQSFLGKHTNNGMLSPVAFEIGQKKVNEAGV